MLFELLNTLFSKLGIIVLAAFIFSRFDMFKSFVIKKELRARDKFAIAVVFGFVGITGTYSGVPVNDAIANSRSIGVVVAGFIGGPFVGIGAGLIAGIHRMLLPTGRFTALACGLSTIIGGAIAGYSKTIMDKSERKWVKAMFITFIIETIQMAMILLIARPFNEALDLVKVIFVPMGFINSFGTATVMMLIQQIHDESERAGAVKAQLALRIATKTMEIFRKGLNFETAKEAAEIILEETGVSAVAFTDTRKIIAHVGVSDDHHLPGKGIYTSITKKVIQTGEYKIAQNKGTIECPNENCQLRSAIVVPLYVEGVISGTLKLYKSEENRILPSDVELARGLGHLISSQLELSQIDYQKALLQKTEIKALQAQIQPHFLFNALNTIISFTRTDTVKARDLLMKLSYFLRASFKTNAEVVDFWQEIKHIESYLDIEQARFSDRLKVVYDIEKGIECEIPPLLLQPIVENALKHGLKDKQEHAILRIQADIVDKYLRVRIKDNGIGITEDKIVALLQTNNGDSGIGIYNVNERLKSIYGTALSISSVIGEGTTFSMDIPLEV